MTEFVSHRGFGLLISGFRWLCFGMGFYCNLMGTVLCSVIGLGCFLLGFCFLQAYTLNQWYLLMGTLCSEEGLGRCDSVLDRVLLFMISLCEMDMRVDCGITL